MAADTVPLPRGGDLGKGVHRKSTGTCQPELVSQPMVEREESAPVARGAMTEPGALDQGARPPDQLASGREQLRESSVGGRDVSQRGDDARRAVAPLRAYPP